VVLGCLAWFKYANLAVHTLRRRARRLNSSPIPWTNVILPIALSFTALQAVSYLIDVRRKTVGGAELYQLRGLSRHVSRI